MLIFKQVRQFFYIILLFLDGSIKRENERKDFWNSRYPNFFLISLLWISLVCKIKELEFQKKIFHSLLYIFINSQPSGSIKEVVLHFRGYYKFFWIIKYIVRIHIVFTPPTYMLNACLCSTYALNHQGCFIKSINLLQMRSLFAFFKRYYYSYIFKKYVNLFLLTIVYHTHGYTTEALHCKNCFFSMDTFQKIEDYVTWNDLAMGIH